MAKIANEAFSILDNETYSIREMSFTCCSLLVKTAEITSKLTVHCKGFQNHRPICSRISKHMRFGSLNAFGNLRRHKVSNALSDPNVIRLNYPAHLGQ